MTDRQILATLLLWLALLPIAHLFTWPDTIPCQPGTHRADTAFDRLIFTHTCEVNKP